MRYVDFKLILEYDRSKTAQSMETKLLQAAQQDQIFWNQVQDQVPELQVDAVLEQLEKMDPSANKKYVQWLARQYVNRQFRLEDAPRVQKILTYFTERDVIRDFRRKGLSIDINQYTFQKLRAEIADSAQGGVDNTQTEPDQNLEYENIKDMSVIYSGDLGQLIIPKSEAASCELGADTNWCTAWDKEKNQFDNYNKDGPIFVWIEPDGEKYQFHFESTQFMNQDDESIEPEKLQYFREKNPITSKLFKSRESVIARSGQGAAGYAMDVIEGPWPAAEPAISKIGKEAVKYAMYVIKGRWPEGEAAIAKDGMAAANYARHILERPWPAAEPAIAKEGPAALAYASAIIKGRWPKGEAAIAKDGRSAFVYARDIIKGKWPEGEAAIAKNSWAAKQYASDIIEGRWPEGEAAIAKDAREAYFYARNVIKGRWPAGEPAIMSGIWKKEYEAFVKSL